MMTAMYAAPDIDKHALVVSTKQMRLRSMDCHKIEGEFVQYHMVMDIC